VLLWSQNDSQAFTWKYKLWITAGGILLWLPQGIVLLAFADVTQFIPRFLHAMHSPVGLWNLYPLSIWMLIFSIAAGVLLLFRSMDFFFLALLVSGVFLAVFSFGASGWTTDVLRYQSEAVFFAMPIVMLFGVRFKGLIAALFSGLFIWTTLASPLPNTIEQQEFRFLQTTSQELPGKATIILSNYHPKSPKGAICAFPSTMFLPNHLTFYGQRPFGVSTCYYGSCQAARGTGIVKLRWLAHIRLYSGMYRYGVSYPPQVDIGFYPCAIDK